MTKETEAVCPICKNIIELDEEFDACDIDIGLVFYCPECDTELEIVRMDPMVVERTEDAGDEGADWDDEYDDENEDLY
ncbi:MAG: hypothetical protein JW844_07810 [Candidatus Omnitrophica bacterium]|nr:hypothetical protein [Candidatus Omnitrophota bacterium]